MFCEFKGCKFLHEELKPKAPILLPLTEGHKQGVLFIVTLRPLLYIFAYFREPYIHECSTFVICVAQDDK